MCSSPLSSLPPIIDVEASGLHFDSYPVEIAVLGNDTVSSWLIAREPEWQYWDPIAEDLHGISRETLRERGVSAKQVALELNATVQALGGLVYSDSAAWDRSWIQTLYRASGIPLGFQVAAIQQALIGAQQGSFQSHRQQLETSGRYRVHRASEDVKLILEAYRCARLDRP